MLHRAARNCCTTLMSSTIPWRRCISSMPLPREPSEIHASSSPEPPKRAREILAKVDAPDHWKRFGMISGSTSLIGGGVGLLGYTHLEWLTPLLPDAAGVAMLLLGGGMAAAVARMPRADSRPRSKARAQADAGQAEELRFEIVPLNDDMRYASAYQALSNRTGSGHSELTSDGDSLGAAEGFLKEADDSWASQLEKKRANLSEELLQSVRDDLDNGLPARRIRQRLEPRLFVIDFDTRARAQRDGREISRPPSTRVLLDTLREQVNFLLRVASPYDEVVVRITSPGGPVSDYGLAAAQLARLKASGVATTACVDLVAASGGYMLACAAGRVLSAPFAIVGSIGVVAQAPNVHRLLDKSGVEVVQRTAGEYKRTLQVFQPNTPEGLAKFDEELAAIHAAFVAHVATHRAEAIGDVPAVCTGESWLGVHAQPLGLVDGLATSDEYLRARQMHADAYLLRPTQPKRPSGVLQMLTRFSEAATDAISAVRRMTDAMPLALYPASSSMHAEVVGADDTMQALSRTAAEAANPSKAAGAIPWRSLEGSGMLRCNASEGLAALGSELPQLRASESGGALEADAARIDERRM